MFSTSHQSLVDDLGGIVAAGIYVYALLDNRVRARAESLSHLVPTRLYLRARSAWRPIVLEFGRGIHDVLPLVGSDTC